MASNGAKMYYNFGSYGRGPSLGRYGLGVTVLGDSSLPSLLSKMGAEPIILAVSLCMLLQGIVLHVMPV